MTARLRPPFPRVCAFDNLYLAFRRARRGKRDREEVAAFEYDLEGNLLRLQADLRRGGEREVGPTFSAMRVFTVVS